MERRNFIRRAGTLAGAALAGIATGAAPTPAGLSTTTFVLVHGAWHGAQHWSRVTAPLTALGYRTVALDLPAHGLCARFPKAYFSAERSGLRHEISPVRELTLDDAAGAVIGLLENLRGLGRIVLVGHSMAGNVITRVGERAPELVDRLVYLAAFLPLRLPSPADYARLPEAGTEHGQSLLLGDPAALGAARIDPRSADPGYLAAMHAGYYGDVDDATFRAFANTLTPDLPLQFYTGRPQATREHWGRIPRSYIRPGWSRCEAATRPSLPSPKRWRAFSRRRTDDGRIGTARRIAIALLGIRSAPVHHRPRIPCRNTIDVERIRGRTGRPVDGAGAVA